MPSKPLDPVLILGDCHIPYEDPQAWDLVLQAGTLLQPKHLWVLGDFVDFYSISSHDKDPQRARLLETELETVKLRLDELDALRAKHKVFVAGNHEDRLRRYLATKAPELDGIVSIPKLLSLQKRGWQYVAYKDHLKVGKIHLTHDVGASGRNAVFRALDTYQHSVLVGHSHRLCYLVEGNAVGEQKLAASFGWLGDRKQIDYMQVAKAAKDWALGFGIGWMEPKTGVCYLTPVPILVQGNRYSCCVNGNLLET